MKKIKDYIKDIASYIKTTYRHIKRIFIKKKSKAKQNVLDLYASDAMEHTSKSSQPYSSAASSYPKIPIQPPQTQQLKTPPIAPAMLPKITLTDLSASAPSTALSRFLTPSSLSVPQKAIASSDNVRPSAPLAPRILEISMSSASAKASTTENKQQEDSAKNGDNDALVTELIDIFQNRSTAQDDILDNLRESIKILDKLIENNATIPPNHKEIFEKTIIFMIESTKDLLSKDETALDASCTLPSLSKYLQLTPGNTTVKESIQTINEIRSMNLILELIKLYQELKEMTENNKKGYDITEMLDILDKLNDPDTVIPEHTKEDLDNTILGCLQFVRDRLIEESEKDTPCETTISNLALFEQRMMALKPNRRDIQEVLNEIETLKSTIKATIDELKESLSPGSSSVSGQPIDSKLNKEQINQHINTLKDILNKQTIDTNDCVSIETTFNKVLKINNLESILNAEQKASISQYIELWADKIIENYPKLKKEEAEEQWHSLCRIYDNPSCKVFRNEKTKAKLQEFNKLNPLPEQL
jgi:hypothetical protein